MFVCTSGAPIGHTRWASRRGNKVPRRVAGISIAIATAVLCSSARGDVPPRWLAFESQGYEQIAERANVTVYKHGAARTIRLGADGRFPFPQPMVLAVLLDYRNQVRRIGRLSEARVLSRGRGWLVVYQRLNLPVIDDRDFTLFVTWRPVAGGGYRIVYRTANAKGPPARDGVVRVKLHQGSWQLRPAAGNSTRVRFKVDMDLGGSLPMWLARWGSGKEIPQLFVDLQRMLVQRSGAPPQTGK